MADRSRSRSLIRFLLFLVPVLVVGGLVAHMMKENTKLRQELAKQSVTAGQSKAPAPTPATQAAAQAAASQATVTATQVTTTSLQAAAKPVPAGEAVYAAYYGKKFMQGPPTPKTIALTFDDGPNDELTPQVLQILKANNIKATFFMLGQSVQKAPETAKMVAAEGHELGCHSINHPRLIKKSADVVKQEIVGSAELVEQVTGKRPHLFRPPFGEVNKAIRDVCEANGLVIVHWSVDPRDWAPKSTPDMVYQHMMKQARSGGIVCIHDVHARTVAALPKIITDLKAQGYEFVTVSQMLANQEKFKASMPVIAGGVAGGVTTVSAGGSGVVGATAEASSTKIAIPLGASAVRK